MSDNTETFWLVMRVRRWENMAANGMDIAPAPELGTGYVCVFDTEAAARAACQDGDTVAAVRHIMSATPWQLAGRKAAPQNITTCAQCGIEWEEGTGANEFGCWNCGSVRSVNVSLAEAKEMRIAYTRAEHLRIAEREIKAGNYPRF